MLIPCSDSPGDRSLCYPLLCDCTLCQANHAPSHPPSSETLSYCSPCLRTQPPLYHKNHFPNTTHIPHPQAHDRLCERTVCPSAPQVPLRKHRAPQIGRVEAASEGEGLQNEILGIHLGAAFQVLRQGEQGVHHEARCAGCVGGSRQEDPAADGRVRDQGNQGRPEADCEIGREGFQ